MNATIILFEDDYLDGMHPITLTRPAFDVSCAGYSLYSIANMIAKEVRYIIRDYLQKVTANRADKKQPSSEHPVNGPVLFLNASLAPDVRFVAPLKNDIQSAEPFLATSGQRIAAALIPEPGRIPEGLTASTITPFLLEEHLPLRHDHAFKTFDYTFHVIGAQEDLFPENISHKIRTGAYKEIKEGVFTGKNIDIAESAVLHAEDGPIMLDDNVRIMDFTYLCGPLFVGRNSRIIERSSIKEFTSIGQTCKIGGEVEACIIESYTNKQHHGFLGHSYVGSWVNLGAGTSNSDLKNTYGKIRISHMGKRLDTGMQFFGCIIGDYAKTAINTSIFTGKIIGVNSMLYGYVGQNVASFCNYAKSFGQITECSLEQAIITQKRMYARRRIEQTQDDIDLLTSVFDLTREERNISSNLPVL